MLSLGKTDIDLVCEKVLHEMPKAFASADANTTINAVLAEVIKVVEHALLEFAPSTFDFTNVTTSVYHTLLREITDRVSKEEVASIQAALLEPDTVSTSLIKAMRVEIDHLLDISMRALRNRTMNEGIQQRARIGIIKDTPHDMGPARYFLERTPRLRVLREALSFVDIELSVTECRETQHAWQSANNVPLSPLDYGFCSRCSRLTSDTADVHAPKCTGRAKGDSSVIALLPMTLDHISALSATERVDDESGLVISLPFVTAYTLETPIFRRLNALLRSIHVPAQQAQLEQRYGPYFVGLMSEMPRLKAFAGTVYRGIDVPVSLSYYSKDSLITWEAFSSTSYDAAVARGFLGARSPPVGTLFVIHSVTGRDVSAFSGLPEEKEVLMLPGSQFRVLRHVEEGTKRLLEAALRVSLSSVCVIELTEVVLRTHGDILDAIAPELQDNWGPQLNAIFTSEPYLARLRAFAGANHYEARGAGRELQVRMPVDGFIGWHNRLPLSDLPGTDLLIREALRGCEVSVLKTVLAATRPGDVDVDIGASWVGVNLQVRPATAAWLASWLAMASDAVLQRGDASYRTDLALAFAGATASTLPPSRTIEMLEKLLPHAQVAIPILLVRAVERGAPEVLTWLAKHVEPAELSALRVCASRGNGVAPVRKAPLVVGSTLRARVSPEDASAMVQALLALGVDPNAKDAEGAPALFYACRYGVTPIVEQLLAMPSIAINCVCGTGRATPLMAAAEHGHLKVVRMLLAHNPPAIVDARSSDETTALIYAAQNGNPKVLQLLIYHGANISATTKAGVSALYKAAEGGHEKAVEVLLRSGAEGMLEVTYNSYTPLHIAARFGHEPALRLLLDAGADPFARAPAGDMPIHLAAQEGHAGVVGELLDRKVDVNVAMDEEHTPLTRAAERGCANVVRLLLERGADPKLSLTDGTTALELARKRDHSDVIIALEEFLQRTN